MYKLRKMDIYYAITLSCVMSLPGALYFSMHLLLWSLLLHIILSFLAIYDLRIRRLPNVFTLPLISLGIVFHMTFMPASLYEAIIGLVLGYGCVMFINIVYQHVRKRDGIGYGDAKLLAAAGAWLGGSGLPPLLMIASISALIHVGIRKVRGEDLTPNSEIPFGPYLVLGFWFLWTAYWIF